MKSIMKILAVAFETKYTENLKKPCKVHLFSRTDGIIYRIKQLNQAVEDVNNDMILSHQKFDFGEKSLIEKLTIQAPFRFTVNFQNEACFVYFVEGTAKINSPIEQKRIGSGESVLLKCGSYFSDLMKYSPGGRYEILVFHLFPDMLRKIYKHEVPAFMKPSERKSFIHKVVGEDTIRKFVESLYFYFDDPSLVSDELLELKVRELILLLVQTKNAESVVSLFSDLFACHWQVFR